MAARNQDFVVKNGLQVTSNLVVGSYVGPGQPQIANGAIISGNVGIGTTNVIVGTGLGVYNGNIQVSGDGFGYLFADGSFQNTSAKNTPPGGSNGTIQFNQSNSFAGNNLFVFDSSNVQLGVGTATARSTLDVVGNILISNTNSTTSGILFPDGSFQTTAVTPTLSYGNYGTVQFAGNNNVFSGDSTNFYWDSVNTVLGISNINVASQATIGTIALFAGNSNVSGINFASVNAFVGNALTINGSSNLYGNLYVSNDFTVGGTVYFSNVGGIQNLTVNSLTSNTYIQAAETITTNNLVANVNVGIGTATVNYPLDVYGNLHIGNTATQSGILFPDGSFQGTAAAYTPSYGMPGTIQLAGNANAFTGNTSALFWDDTNRVLEVNGTVDAAGPVIALSVTSNTTIQSAGIATVAELYSNASIHASSTITGNALKSNTFVHAIGEVVGGSVTSNTIIQAASTVYGGDIVSNTTIQASGQIVGNSINSNSSIQAEGQIVGNSLNSNSSIQAAGNITAGGLNSNGTIVGSQLTSNSSIQAAGQATVNSLISNVNVGIGTATVSGSNVLSVYGSTNNVGNIYIVNTASTISGIMWPDGTFQNTAPIQTAQTPSYGAQGTVQFAGVSNTFSGNTASLFWDDARQFLNANTVVTTNVIGNYGLDLSTQGAGAFLSITNNGHTSTFTPGGTFQPAGAIVGGTYGSNQIDVTQYTMQLKALLYGLQITTSPDQGTTNYVWTYDTDGQLSAPGGIGSIGNISTAQSVYADSIYSNTSIQAAGNLTVGNITSNGSITSTGEFYVAGNATITGNLFGYGNTNVFYGRLGIGTSNIKIGDNLTVVGGNINVASFGTGIFFPDGSFQQSSAGSSAAGFDEYVQFNRNGSFAGQDNFLFNYTTSSLGIGTTTVNNSLAVYGSSPALFNTTNGSNQQLIVGNTAANGAVVGFNSGTQPAYGYLAAAGASTTNIIVTKLGTGIGGITIPRNTLDVGGGTAIGSPYGGVFTAPTDGLIVSGKVGIGTSFPLSPLDVSGNTSFGSNVSVANEMDVDLLIVNTSITSTALNVIGAANVGSLSSNTTMQAAGTATVNALIGNNNVYGGTLQSGSTALVNELISNTNTTTATLNTTGLAMVSSLIGNNNVFGASLQSSGGALVNGLVSNTNITTDTLNAYGNVQTAALISNSTIQSAGTATVNALISNNNVFGATLQSSGVSNLANLIVNTNITTNLLNVTAEAYLSDVISNNNITTATLNTTGVAEVNSLISNTSIQAIGSVTVNSLKSNTNVNASSANITNDLYAGELNVNGTAQAQLIISNTDISTQTLGASSTIVGQVINSNTTIQSAGTTTVNELISNTTVTAGNGLIATAGGLRVTGNTSIAGNAYVSGNLYVGGNIVAVAADQINSTAPIIFVANANPGDVWDLGLVGSYVTDNHYYTGVVRDYINGAWTVFDTAVNKPNLTVDWNQAGLTYGGFIAGNINAAGQTASISSSTGAITIFGGGGLGVGGAINAGDQIATTAGLNIGATAIVNALVSNTTIQASGDAVFATVTSNGMIQSAGTATVNALVSNTSISADSLQVTSGVVVNSLTSNTFIQAAGLTTTQTFQSNGAATIGGNLVVNGNTLITDSTPTTDYNTGALVVNGGIGVAGNIHAQGSLTAGNVYANSASFFGADVTGFNALYAGIQTGYSLLPNNIAQFSGNSNSYVQINLENISSGTNVSSDYIATADNGTDSTYYVDLGINGSAFDAVNAGQTSQYANDSYLIGVGNADTAGYNGGNLVVGTSTPNTVVRLVAGGLMASNIIATFGTGSADIAVPLTVQGDVGVTGNIQATGNIVAGAITSNSTIQSAGVAYLQEIYSNLNIHAIGTITGNALKSNTFVHAIGEVVGGSITSNSTIQAAGTATVNALYSNTFIQSAGNITVGGVNSNGTIVGSSITSNSTIQSVGIAQVGELYSNLNIHAISTITGNALKSNTFVHAIGEVVGGSINSNTTIQAAGTATVNGLYSNSFVQSAGNITAGGLNSNGTIVGSSITSNSTIQAPGNVTVGNLVSNGSITTTGLGGNIIGVNTLFTVNVDASGKINANNIIANVNVGIGTATAQFPLDVYGNIHIGNTATISGIVFSDGTFMNTAATGGGGGSPSFGDPGTLQFAGASNTFAGNSSQLFWNNTSNFLGVGTGTPAYPLDLFGNLHISNTATISGIVFSDGTFQDTAAAPTPSYGTIGTVQVSDGAGGFTGDSTNFNYDTTTNILSVDNVVVGGGCSYVSQAQLSVVNFGNFSKTTLSGDQLTIQADYAAPQIAIYGGYGGTPYLQMYKSDNTFDAPTPVGAGDILGGLTFSGYQSNGSYNTTAQIQALVSQPPTFSANPTDLIFFTGDSSANEQLRIDYLGNVGLVASQSVIGGVTANSFQANAQVGIGTSTFLGVGNVLGVYGNSDFFGNINISNTATTSGILFPDGTFQTTAATGGGSGTPGGYNTDIQFNNNGVFGGNNSFVYNGNIGAVGIGTSNPVFPLDVWGNVHIGDSSGQNNGIVFADGTFINSVNQLTANTNIQTFTFTATAGQTTFSVYPYTISGGGLNLTMVFVNGVYQRISTYSWVGTNIVLAVGAPQFARVEIKLTIAAALAPTGYAIAGSNIFNVTTDGVTVYSAGFTYAPSYLNVFLNGVKLVQGYDYTATDGANVTFAAAPQVGSIVQLTGWNSGGTTQVQGNNIYPVTVANVTSYNTGFAYTPGYIDVYSNGVKLISGYDFTATDGATVQFVVAPDVGSVLQFQGWIQGSTIGQLATQRRALYVASAGQSTFLSNGPYAPGYVDVYVNGIKLVYLTDFTASNGSSVTLVNGLSAGANVEIVSSMTFAIGDVARRSGDIFTGNVGIGTNNNSSAFVVVGNSNFYGNVNIFKPAGGYGMLMSQDGASFAGNISAGGTLTVGNAAVFNNNVNVTGYGSFGGAGTFGGPGLFGGNLTANGNLAAAGTSTLSGNVNLGAALVFSDGTYQRTANQVLVLNDISTAFDGITASFNLSIGSTNINIATPQQLLVAVGGAVLAPFVTLPDLVDLNEVTIFNRGYKLTNGNTITFARAPSQQQDFSGRILTNVTPINNNVTYPFKALNVAMAD